MDASADDNQLSGLEPTPWTMCHGLLSGRPQVRVLPGALSKAQLPRVARRRLERFYTHCRDANVVELDRLASIIRRWKHEALGWHRPPWIFARLGASVVSAGATNWRRPTHLRIGSAWAWALSGPGIGYAMVSTGRTTRVLHGTRAVRLGRYACGLMRVRLSLVTVGVCCLEALGAETPRRSPMC
jgi:hypothetical protein